MKTKKVRVGKMHIGGDAPISVQSMTQRFFENLVKEHTGGHKVPQSESE